MPKIELTVNGARRPVQVDADQSLLSALRDELDLTGTKYGCGEGQCGACTVLVGGRPTPSCMTKATSVAGASITTIEGIEENGRLHPVQEAFLELGAMQCGYCTPGMILEGVALVRETPMASEAEIAAAMERHVCRCCTYPRILAALEKAARAMKGTRK